MITCIREVRRAKGLTLQDVADRCRPSTTAHDDYYKDIQVGTRCCSAATSG